MSAVPVLIPASQTDGAIITGGALGVDGELFYIKAETIRPRYYPKVRRSTGEGEQAPASVDNQFMYGDVLVDGWMRSGQGIGLLNMIADNTAVGDPTFPFRYWYGTDDSGERFIDHPSIMEAIRINWALDAGLVGVSMSMKKNGAMTEGVDDNPALPPEADNSLVSPALSKHLELLESPTQNVLQIGAGTADSVKIKVEKAQITVSAVLRESTGDGDVDPFWTSNLFLETTVLLDGLVIENENGDADGIGIASMIAPNRRLRPLFSGVTLNLGDVDRTLTMAASIDRISMDYERAGAGIPLRVALRKQPTFTTGTESLSEGA